jgi:adenylate cyclase
MSEKILDTIESLKALLAEEEQQSMSKDLDLIGRLIGHRLQQEDIAQLLQDLEVKERATFTSKLAILLRRSSALVEVSRRMSETLRLDVLLPRMVSLVSEFMGAERCTIFLYDALTDELFSRVAEGEQADELRFPADAGIAGSVFTDGKPLSIDDAYQDKRFNPDVDKKTGYKTHNILCVPIQDSQSRSIGVIQVLNKQKGPFDELDTHLLEAIASQAASAFVNAQLHEQITKAREEEAQLLEVTNAISRELQLGPLLKRVMEAVTTILSADRSTLFLYDEKTEELWSHVAQGINTNEIRFPCHVGIAGSVFTNQSTINIPDAYNDDRFNPEIDKKTGYKTNSILCMPVMSKSGDVTGVIQVLNKQGGPFTTLDENRLQAFSSQISIAIENARLFEEVVRIKNYNESILESMSNGVITVDADRTIAKANRAALRMLQLSDASTELEGQDATAFFGEKNAWLLDSMETALSSRDSDTAFDVGLWLPEASKGALDSPVSVNISTVPMKGEQDEGSGCLFVFEDITTEKRLRGTMARYMTKELADQLLQEGEDALGGTMQRASIFFSDIRRFTSISEAIGPQGTVTMLNEYFSIMVDILMENHGILDKYIGDAIMAVFGVPFPSEHDADRAVQAGIGMLRALRLLNEKRVAEQQLPIDIGIGINTDEVVSGNIGSTRRMDYTVIGDGVNLASRLEGANKYYQTKLLISEFTADLLQNEYLLREVDCIRVKGKNEPVGIFEVLDYHDDTTFPGVREAVGLFREGLRSYRNREWSNARTFFSRVRSIHDDGLSAMYIERCDHFLTHPPSKDWDGVWALSSK